MDIITIVRIIAVLLGFLLAGIGAYFLISKKNKIGIGIAIAGLLMVLSNIFALIAF